MCKHSQEDSKDPFFIKETLGNKQALNSQNPNITEQLPDYQITNFNETVNLVSDIRKNSEDSFITTSKKRETRNQDFKAFNDTSASVSVMNDDVSQMSFNQETYAFFTEEVRKDIVKEHYKDLHNINNQINTDDTFDIEMSGNTKTKPQVIYGENGEILYKGGIKDGLYHDFGELYRNNKDGKLMLEDSSIIFRNWVSYRGEWDLGVKNGMGEFFIFDKDSQKVLKILQGEVRQNRLGI